jgi:hypothetical protein
LFTVWKEIIVIIDFGENGGKVFKRHMQLAINHCTDGVGLSSGGDFDSILVAFFNEGLLVNCVQVIEDFLHLSLERLDECKAIRLYLMFGIALLPSLFCRA